MNRPIRYDKTPSRSDSSALHPEQNILSVFSLAAVVKAFSVDSWLQLLFMSAAPRYGLISIFGKRICAPVFVPGWMRGGQEPALRPLCCTGQRRVDTGEGTPCLTNVLRRQLASQCVHQHKLRGGEARAEGGDVARRTALLCEPNDSELWGGGFSLTGCRLFTLGCDQLKMH